TAMILLDNGRSATDQATLDFCNVTYKSETSRTTRVQVDYANAGQSASNEVVRYRAGGAASAFAEIQAAAKTCPTTYTTGQTTIGHIQRASKISGLVANQLVLTFAASFALSTGGSITNWSTAVYQFDGDFFSGVYVFGSDRAAVLKTATDLGAKAAKHLAEAVSGAPGTGGGPFSAPGPAAGSSDGTQV
ncbi:MAG: hypothetical protein QOJ62_1744, partial [Actinomycetota bacterium]|nr:hypothetical protein [Actinomycetota bacterium]